MERLYNLLLDLCSGHPGADEDGPEPQESSDPPQETSPTRPGMYGAVIFCDCRDDQMEQLQRWLGSRLQGRADVYSILARHTTAARGRIMGRIHERSGGIPQVLLVRYRMCAVGVNYIFADNIILYTTPHRADFAHQAVGRLCRLGQRRRVVNIWTVVYANSFEADIWRDWQRHLAPEETNGRNATQMSVLARRLWARRLM